MPSSAVAFEGVVKRYGAVAAVDGVTLAVDSGSFVALVGASGSGKSTLLKTVNRLVLPDAGRVAIDGADVAAADPAALRRGIGYVFQNVGLFPHLSVAENVAMPARLTGGRADVPALLDRVGLPRDVGARMPSQLSGGQQQRVGVARALASSARLMLMDEPFGALDPVTRAELGEGYRALHASLGLTTIMVTHDMAEALLLADRIVVMGRGRIVADGSPAAMLAGEAGDDAAALVAIPRRQAERIVGLGAR